MKNSALVLPDALTSIGNFFKSVNSGAISDELPEILALRAGQINGCGDCVRTHVQNLSIGVTDMFDCRTTGVREPAGTSWSRRRP
ncbi:carboxymuconolactone decarboxylase family protein [Streptomyces sp. ISL-43]|nr:carboxymuconolactone decarboxylase family protein [Streptomyces sp. ISL-43]